MTVVVYGASGFTGELVVRALAALGITDLVLSGRNGDKLRALAELSPGARIAEAAVDDDSALDRACDGARVVVSTAGPFVRFGEPLVRAALRARAHFLDTTGEQAFMALVLERYHGSAVDKGVAVVNAHGFEYALGCAAGALAAELPGARSLDVYYRVEGFGTTRGTQKSALAALTADALERRSGRLVPLPKLQIPGRIRIPGQLRADATLRIPGGEALHLGRAVDGLYDVATHLVVPPRVAFAMSAAWAARPAFEAVSKRGLGALLERRIDAGAVGPSDASRRRARFAVHALAKSEQATRSVTVRGKDPYGLTSALVANAVKRLLREVPRAVGVVSSDQAFGARVVLDELAPLGVSVEVGA